MTDRLPKLGNRSVLFLVLVQGALVVNGVVRSHCPPSLALTRDCFCFNDALTFLHDLGPQKVAAFTLR